MNLMLLLCITAYDIKYDWSKNLWLTTDPNGDHRVIKVEEEVSFADCGSLSFFHTLTSKEDTSFVYGWGKVRKKHETLLWQRDGMWQQRMKPTHVTDQDFLHLMKLSATSVSFLMRSWVAQKCCTTFSKLTTLFPCSIQTVLLWLTSPWHLLTVPVQLLSDVPICTC